MKSNLRLPVVFLASALIAGCATSNYHKARSTSSTLSDAGQSIDRTLVPLDAVAVALAELVNHPEPDRAPQFRTFSAAVTDFEAQAVQIGDLAATLQASGDAYLEQWEVELATIENDEIQDRSRERKVEVAARMKRVRENYLRTAKELSPLLSNLRDLRTALATDLTAGGVESIRGLEKKVKADANALRASLVELSADFKSLGLSLSPMTS